MTMPEYTIRAQQARRRGAIGKMDSNISITVKAYGMDRETASRLLYEAGWEHTHGITWTETHQCVWGPVERSHLTGNPHRKCMVPGCKKISLDLDGGDAIEKKGGADEGAEHSEQE